MFNIIKKIYPENTEPVIKTAISPHQKSRSLFGFLEERIRETITADIIINKRKYLERPNQDVDSLLFWKVTAMEPKPLQQCATKYFCIPASSAESERVFSTAPLIIEQRRAGLKPKNFNLTMCLNQNFKNISN